jgi:glycerol-3-phosphate cytidylyltransferase
MLAKTEDAGTGMKTIITFGTFDVFHIGHLRILERAGQLGERLIVGVSSDALNMQKKGRMPVYSQSDRMGIVAGLKCVDSVFLEESLEKKADYIRQFNADTLVMGDDWAGRFDSLSYLCEVVYFPRTPSISTTSIIEVVKGYK